MADQPASSSGKPNQYSSNRRGTRRQEPNRGRAGYFRRTASPPKNETPEDACTLSDTYHYPPNTQPFKHRGSRETHKRGQFNKNTSYFQPPQQNGWNEENGAVGGEPLYNSQQSLASYGQNSSHSKNGKVYYRNRGFRKHHKGPPQGSQDSLEKEPLKDPQNVEATDLRDDLSSEQMSHEGHQNGSHKQSRFSKRKEHKHLNLHGKKEGYSNHSSKPFSGRHRRGGWGSSDTLENLPPSHAVDGVSFDNNNFSNYERKFGNIEQERTQDFSREFRKNQHRGGRRGNFHKRFQAPHFERAEPSAPPEEDLNNNNNNHENELAFSKPDFNEKYNPEAAIPKKAPFHQKLFDKFKFRSKSSNKKQDNPYYNEEKATQRERLEEQLKSGEYECMVCYEAVQPRNSIWNCPYCFNLFHLECIGKWAAQPKLTKQGPGWRCPTCQHIAFEVPKTYFCFCRKFSHPNYNFHLTPHSCGNMCGRRKQDSECPHRCTLQCHPGPCPECVVQIQKSCCCGKNVLPTRCGFELDVTCSSVCGKKLNCGIHTCSKICHPDSCEDCEEEIEKECFCGKIVKKGKCSAETTSGEFFKCDEMCNKKLDCGNHFCQELCHPSDCLTCKLQPKFVTRCACGKVPIAELPNNPPPRTSCLDPLPLCDKICGKEFPCGKDGEPHRCSMSCHSGDCVPCSLTMVVKCRCKSITKEVDCQQALDGIHCERRCNKRKDCGRHKCLQLCCNETSHRCELVCNRQLSCGSHSCPLTCHIGNCPPCSNVSFDDLTCTCGETVLMAPIACGARPPECSKLCTRQHACSHPISHLCHSEASCPPCASLTEKMCFGNHELKINVPCFLAGISCGKTCKKLLPCGFHTCQDLCHQGTCKVKEEKCTKPCLKPRQDCGHPCGAPCHENECPEIPCKSKIILSCPCGNRSEKGICGDAHRAYKQLPMSIFVAKMHEVQAGQTVDMSDVLNAVKRTNHKIECNGECSIIERNRKLAEALQIENPDLSGKPGPPSYSDFLKEEAKKSPSFVKAIYEKLSELVNLAKQSKQKSRSASFAPMNSNSRRVVHELAEFFNCETQSFDQEPKRNVVATAHKDKCTVPSCSVMSVIQRDNGLRKGPMPLPNIRPPTPPSPSIDYFDYPVEF